MNKEQATQILLQTAEAYIRKGCEPAEAKAIIFAIEAFTQKEDKPKK